MSADGSGLEATGHRRVARWRVVDGRPVTAPPEPDTAGGWAWALERDRVYRGVCVYVMLETLTLDEEVAQPTLDVIDSKGLSEIVNVLDLEEPPEQVFMGLRGRLIERPPAAAP